jgi:hypothetical protein
MGFGRCLAWPAERQALATPQAATGTLIFSMHTKELVEDHVHCRYREIPDAVFALRLAV